MSYRVLLDGTIECDSVDEAIALQRAIRNGSAKEPFGPVASTPKHVSPNFPRLWESLEPRGRRVLIALAETGAQSLTSTELANRCGMSTTKLSPTMVHLHHAAKKANIRDLVTRKQLVVNRKPTSIYKLNAKYRDEVMRHRDCESGEEEQKLT